MIELPCRAALLDVEGTTSSVSYVYDVMFPFARRELEAYVARHWDDAQMDPVREQFAQDADAESFAEWSAASGDATRLLVDRAVSLMDADVKATGLKQLQGMIWESGFKSGELRSHLFPDVAQTLSDWQAAGIDLKIYSSGSVHAQRLFFGHTEAGDLTPLISGHYDTTTGPKREAESYQAIANDWGEPPASIAFFSDVTQELDAARAAGMQTVLVCRPGNADPATTDPAHESISSFDEVSWKNV